MTSAAQVPRLWLFLAATIIHGASALSGCQLCDQTGDCSQAYRGGPGQFCGHWLDRENQRQSCCCPNGAVCRVSNYACNCAYSNRPSRYNDSVADPLLWLWWLLGAMALALCCGSCLWMLFARRNRNGYDDETMGSPIPVAYPVTAGPPGTPATVYGPATANYGTAPLYSTPAYVAPPYAGGGGYGYSGQRGMGAGTGAALGGAAGLAGGLLLGQALADAGRYDGGGGFAGDSGGGGGFDAGVGDFAGDF